MKEIRITLFAAALALLIGSAYGSPKATTLAFAQQNNYTRQGVSDSGTFVQNTLNPASSSGINSCFCYTASSDIRNIGLKGALKQIQVVSGNGTTTVNYNTGIKHFTWSIEYPKGTVIYQGRWLNNKNVIDLGTLAAGGSYDTGLATIGNTIKAGTQFWIRTYLGGLTGSVPTLRKATGSGFSEASTNSNGEKDGTMANTHPSNNGNSGWVPDVIYTSTSSQSTSVTVLGDSIASGFQDHYEGDGSGGITSLGWFGRAFGSGQIVDGLNGNYNGLGLPEHRWSAGGRTLANLLASGSPIYDATSFATGYSKAIIALGRNDCTAGTTASKTESNLIALIRQLLNSGCQVYVSTITPYASSTDNFLTTASQTPIANNSIVQTVNTWIRQNGENYNYTLFDIASLVESGGATKPSGVFNAAGKATYSGVVTSSTTKGQFTDNSAKFSTAANQYQFIRWKSGKNTGLSQEILTVNSNHQITCGTNVPNTINAGDKYDVYTRWCAIDNGTSTPDQGEHPSTFAYSYIARQIIHSGLFSEMGGGYSQMAGLANVLEGIESCDSIRVFRLK